MSPGVRFEYGSAYVEHVYLMSVTFDVSKSSTAVVEGRALPEYRKLMKAQGGVCETVSRGVAVCQRARA